MLLADAAQVADGKLNILGGGWSVCGPGPTPMALAIKLEIPPSQTRRKHDWSVVLLDDKDEPVLLLAPDGQRSIVAIQGQIERIWTPESMPPGTPTHLAFAINMAPLPLEPSSHYAWQLSIDNKTRREWRVSFSTRSATPPAS
jgi:hypothetical protein